MNRSSFGHLDLNLLTALIALVEECSTVAAARRLHLAQSTVSGSLARLREIFDDELLVRNGRLLEPTARALELLQAAKPHLEALASAMAETSLFEPASASRIFRLGCTDAVALTLLPALTASLRQQAPACDLVVRLGDFRTLPGMLSTGEVSTALAYLRDSPPANAKTKVLKHSPWVVLRSRQVPPIDGVEDYCSRPHVLVTPVGDLTGFVDDALREIDRQRRIAIGVTSFAMLLGVLPATDMIATVPDFVAHRLAQLSPLEVQPCPIVLPSISNSLAWRAVADRDPGERWFRDLVVEAFRQVR